MNTEGIKTDPELRKLQIRLAEILQEIDRACRKAGICYYVFYGTLLGAVRHKGFIPWDNDVDIAMPREEYEKFLQIADEILPAYLEVKEYRRTKGYPYAFAKVEDCRTTLIEKKIKHLDQKAGIYVDVFPLDGMPANRFRRYLHLKHVRYYDKLRYFLFRDPDKDNKCYKKLFLHLIRIFYSREKVMRKHQRIMRKYPFAAAGYFCEFDGGKATVMQKRILGKPVPVVFEGQSFFGVERADECLTHLYGDYMQLPPENKRIQHKFYYLDLDKPYKI